MVAEHSTGSRPAALLELAAEERRLERELGTAAFGRVLAVARSAATDQAILDLLGSRHQSSGWAILAVGGYGRGELSPCSDVDLMMVTRRRSPEAEEIARALFYSLWDAGLEVSPSVRTVAEALSLAARDLSVQTSCLQARFLAGERGLFDEFQRRALVDARRQGGKAFLRALLADIRQRHERFAGAAYGLEPDLKEGRGGLRDAHALAWAGLVLAGAGSLGELAQLGYLAADEVAAIDLAVEQILRARHQLHRIAGRHTDRLYFAHQQEVAASLGYGAAENGRSAVEAFTRDLNAQAAAISWAADGFWERIEDYLSEGKPRGRQPSRLDLVDGQVPSDPDAALRLFAEAARRGIVVGHGVAREVKSALASAAPIERWSPSACDSLLEVLRSGAVADSLIEAMAGAGLLSLYLPEWEGIRYLTHHDAYHVYTVDRHSALVVRELGLLCDGRSDGGSEGPLTAAVAADLPGLDTLFLAGLVHDLGKGLAGDHTQTGAEIAERIAERIGLPPETTETLVSLVRNHLLLVRTATRRDIDDECVVRRFAEQVGSADRLRMLYLLTVADSIATGPSTWTDWKAALVRDLFLRTIRLLQGEGQASEAGDLLAARQAELADALSASHDPSAVREFLGAMPAAYLLAQPASSVQEHFGLLSQSVDDSVRISVRHVPGSHDELIFATDDRPGLLWRVCGVFALHGINVLEARAYTSARGEVLDVFRLVDAFEQTISDEKRALLTRDLGLVLDGRLSLSYRLGRKLRHYRASRSEPAVQTRVTVDNAASAEYTVVEVHARDRLGLLYAIGRTLSELQVDIHLAKLATRGPEAIDVFYIRDLHGQKITDADHVQEVERAILFELEEFGLEARS